MILLRTHFVQIRLQSFELRAGRLINESPSFINCMPISVPMSNVHHKYHNVELLIVSDRFLDQAPCVTESCYSSTIVTFCRSILVVLL